MGKRRRSVLALPMMVIVRKTPENLGTKDAPGAWGNLAKRFPGKTRAYSPRLLAYRMCMAGALKKEPGAKKETIGEIQKKFKMIAPECKKQVAEKPKILKPRSMTYV
jgi:hypothetical protein